MQVGTDAVADNLATAALTLRLVEEREAKRDNLLALLRELDDETAEAPTVVSKAAGQA